jgi:hypothetical protein
LIGDKATAFLCVFFGDLLGVEGVREWGEESEGGEASERGKEREGGEGVCEGMVATDAVDGGCTIGAGGSKTVRRFWVVDLVVASLLGLMEGLEGVVEGLEEVVGGLEGVVEGSEGVEDELEEGLEEFRDMREGLLGGFAGLESV